MSSCSHSSPIDSRSSMSFNVGSDGRLKTKVVWNGAITALNSFKDQSEEKPAENTSAIILDGFSLGQVSKSFPKHPL